MTEEIAKENQYRYGQVPDPEVNIVKAVLIFNRLNGVYLGAASLDISLCDIDHPHCIYVEDEMDIVNDVVEGGLKIHGDGSWTKDYKVLRPHERSAAVYESELDEQMAYKITKRYTVVEQVNILSRAILKLADKHDIELDELNEMLDYISLVKETNKNQKEFYANHPDYEYFTNERATEIEASRFEGGLHEAIGPRTITGGRVFS